MKQWKALSVAAVMAISAQAAPVTVDSADLDAMKTQIDALNKKVEKLEKDQKKSKKTAKRLKKNVSQLKSVALNDNIKFGVDFRNAIDVLNYKDNDSGETASNPSLLTSRLFLNMAASPMDKLSFFGKLAIYSTWGAHLVGEDSGLKDWSASSKGTDTIMRVKEAYFVYADQIGEQPVSVSIGRRPSTNGFLANYRENEEKPGSPLAHVTNMEVNAAMVKLSWDRFISGAYTKFVYGRAHTGVTTGVYSIGHSNPWGPNAVVFDDDKNVDFFVTLGDAYNNGQYQVMYEWAHIFNTKGEYAPSNDKYTGTSSDHKMAAGTADLFSIGLKVDGIGDGINDFLDSTVAFVSGAYSYYDADDGYILLASSDGGSRSGNSVWAGIVIPDMITENGKIGFEYNHGSKYWTPMTWAEDTAIGSKIAVRGDAYEAYWNFDLFGVKYLPSQLRYTYAQHDYTPNVNCAGWVPSNEVDLTAQDLRFAVSYRY